MGFILKHNKVYIWVQLDEVNSSNYRGNTASRGELMLRFHASGRFGRSDGEKKT